MEPVRPRDSRVSPDDWVSDLRIEERPLPTTTRGVVIAEYSVIRRLEWERPTEERRRTLVPAASAGAIAAGQENLFTETMVSLSAYPSRGDPDGSLTLLNYGGVRFMTTKERWIAINPAAPRVSTGPRIHNERGRGMAPMENEGSRPLSGRKATSAGRRRTSTRSPGLGPTLWRPQSRSRNSPFSLATCWRSRRPSELLSSRSARYRRPHDISGTGAASPSIRWPGDDASPLDFGPVQSPCGTLGNVVERATSVQPPRGTGRIRGRCWTGSGAAESGRGG